MGCVTSLILNYKAEHDRSQPLRTAVRDTVRPALCPRARAIL
jgi:hypothetical protein